MKTLVIPDIHHRTRTVAAIIEHERPDLVIWLGDWFDDFGDNEEISRRTASFLVERINNHPDDIFIWGNHDTHYAFPGKHTLCSGFSQAKHRVISEIMRPRHWDRFEWYVWHKRWLMTHAGLTKPHVPSDVVEITPWLAIQAAEAQLKLRQSQKHWMFTAGMARSGSAPFGGVNWCDTSEFVPIPGVNQIFGHTPSRTPVRFNKPRSSNYCIDTNSRHYMVFDNKGKSDLRFVDDLPRP